MSHEALLRIATWTTKGLLLITSGCSATKGLTDKIPTATPHPVATADITPTKTPESMLIDPRDLKTDALRPDEIREIMKVNSETGVERIPLSQDFIDSGGYFMDFKNFNNTKSIVGFLPVGKNVIFPSLTDGHIVAIDQERNKPYTTLIYVESNAKGQEGKLLIYTISGNSDILQSFNRISIGDPLFYLTSVTAHSTDGSLKSFVQNKYQIEGGYPDRVVISISMHDGKNNNLTFENNILQANGGFTSVATEKPN